MTLYVVPTPIGNLKDITLRAISTLEGADLIACEDTRRTLKLLNSYEIRKPLVSLHRHNERQRSRELADRLEEGCDIALVSDAGTPGISDPGRILIREAIGRGIRVEALPGPSAILPALLLSGLDTDTFLFAGFIDGSDREKDKKLSLLSSARPTLVFYVAPHDLSKHLELVERALGDRRAALARELSKVHEEVLRGHVSELRETARTRDMKGEMVLVVEGAPEEAAGEAADQGDERAWQELAENMKNEQIPDRVIANVLFASYCIPRNRVKKFLTTGNKREAGTNER